MNAKVDIATFNAALGGKVDNTTFNAALADKVDTSTFNTALGSKVDTSTFNTALADKVDTSTFNIALAEKADAKALADKVDQTALDTALAAKLDTSGGSISGPLTIDGRVGIGTAAPAATLAVTGLPNHPLTGTIGVLTADTSVEGTGMCFTQELNVGDVIKINDDVRRVISITNDLSLQIHLPSSGVADGIRAFTDSNLFVVRNGAGDEKFVIDKSGNVGIGASRPQEKLQVEGRIRTGALTIGTWPSSNRYVFFGTNTLNQAAGRSYALLQQSSAGTGRGRTFLNSPVDIRFRINNAERMMLANNGNVGIGTTNPVDKLQVQGRIRAGVLAVGPWPANASRYVFFGTSTLNQAAAGNYALLQQSSAGSGRGRTFLNSPVDIRFRINNVDRMTLANSGNIGIGTSGPRQRLHVVGNIEYSGQLIKLDVANNFTATIRAADLRLGHSGRRSSPGRALVDWRSGNTRQLGLNWGNDWSNGVLYFGSLNRASSRKIKKNIHPISSCECLSALEGLNPVGFNMRNDEEALLHLGFIAEEVPALVQSHNKEGIVNDHIIAILTGVVKDHQKTIETLTAQVEMLKQQAAE